MQRRQSDREIHLRRRCGCRRPGALRHLIKDAAALDGEHFVESLELFHTAGDRVADAMVAAGLDKARAARATSAVERATTERLNDLALDEVEARLWRAWICSDGPQAFVAALTVADLRLALGDKVLVVVTPGGNLVPLRRSLSRIAKRHGRLAVRKADVDDRLKGLVLVDSAGLLPVPGFDAGAFGITGAATRLDKNPPSPEAPSEGFEAPAAAAALSATPIAAPVAAPAPAPATTIDPATLTAGQLEAIERYRDAFFAPAVSIEIPPSAAAANRSADVLVQKTKWHDRLSVERKLYQQPSLEEPTWVDRYRAQLAGLPPDLGARLAWVNRLEAGRVRLVLKNSRTIVTTEPGRAAASRPTLDSIPVIIAHAKRRRWTATTIRGGTNEWQEELARAATRAGIPVTNSELQHVVTSERARMVTVGPTLGT